MSDLATLTLDYIQDQSIPLAWPGLAGRLVENLKMERGLDLTSYSTSTWVKEEATPPLQLLAFNGIRRISPQVMVEVLSPAAQKRHGVSGCRFWQVDELAKSVALDVLACAYNEIFAVPELADSVAQLARRIHLLVPSDDAYDLNFSEPDLPFSVFVSIPLRPLGNIRWRLAEAIIHEASHLQLSLVESQVPLIASPHAQHYSPWRKSARSLGGVLHGLYVFGVIAEWMTKSSAPTSLVRQRLIEIASEARQIESFPNASGLTPAGAALARNILSSISAAASFPTSGESKNKNPVRTHDDQAPAIFDLPDQTGRAEREVVQGSSRVECK